MSLFRGRLFAGALYAGLLFGGQPVTPPDPTPTPAVARGGADDHDDIYKVADLHDAAFIEQQNNTIITLLLSMASQGVFE